MYKWLIVSQDGGIMIIQEAKVPSTPMRADTRLPRGSTAEDYDADTDFSELTSPVIRPSHIPPRLLQDVGRKDSQQSVISNSSRASEPLSHTTTETGSVGTTHTDTSASAKSDTSSQLHQSESMSSSDATVQSIIHRGLSQSLSIEPDNPSQGTPTSSDDATPTLSHTPMVDQQTLDLKLNQSKDEPLAASAESKTDSSQDDEMRPVAVPSLSQIYNSGIEDISPASSPLTPSRLTKEPEPITENVKLDLNKSESTITVTQKTEAPNITDPPTPEQPLQKKQLSLEAYRQKKKAQTESQPKPAPTLTMHSPQKSVTDLCKSPAVSADGHVTTPHKSLPDDNLSTVSSHTNNSISSVKHGIAESLRKTSEWLKASKAAFEQEQRMESERELTEQRLEAEKEAKEKKIESERELRELEVSSQSSLSTSVSERQPEASRVSLASYKARLQKEVGQTKPEKPVITRRESEKPEKPAQPAAEPEAKQSSEATADLPKTIADLSRVKSLVDSVLAQGSSGKKSGSRELLLKKVSFYSFMIMFI